MRSAAIDLRRTVGYVVTDRAGRRVGRVECPMYGTAPDAPDALSVRSRRFTRHRLIVPADTVAAVDRLEGVVGLRIDGSAIRSFL